MEDKIKETGMPKDNTRGFPLKFGLDIVFQAIHLQDMQLDYIIVSSIIKHKMFLELLGPLSTYMVLNYY